MISITFIGCLVPTGLWNLLSQSPKPEDTEIVSKFLPYKKNAAISILVEIFAYLLIIFAHHCKIKIIPHNLCTILLQDKLRVCVFKAFDHQSTNYLLKGWVNFHPHKKNMKMTWDPKGNVWIPKYEWRIKASRYFHNIPHWTWFPPNVFHIH